MQDPYYNDNRYQYGIDFVLNQLSSLAPMIVLMSFIILWGLFDEV